MGELDRVKVGVPEVADKLNVTTVKTR